MNIRDFATVHLNLEELAIKISDYDFPGENSNQDPCFNGGEDGFENCIYDENDKMICGYTVFLSTVINEKNKDLHNRYMLKAQVSYFDNDFNCLDSSEITFSLHECIENIQKKLIKTIKKEIDLDRVVK